MKKKRYVILCLATCMLLLSACGRGREPESGKNVLYYANAQGTGLVKEEYEIKGDSREDEIGNMLDEMQKETDEIEYKSAFSEGVKVEKWNLKGQNVDLYLNGKYEKLPVSDQLLLKASVVQTLSQIKGVDGIRFFVGDSPLKEGDGRETGYMRAEDFVQNTGSSLHSYKVGNIRLYFANEKGDKLSAEEVSVRYNSNMSLEKLIVEQLIKGPSAKGNYPVISPDTEVLSVSTKDGICYVNFNEEFLNTEYKIDPKLTVYALVNSITGSGDASKVQILVNGETDLNYQGSIHLDKPFSSNEELMEEEKQD